MTANENWWESFYDSLLADILLETKDPEEVSATIQFLEKFCQLSPGARVFDQCCGTGRLSIPLAEKGHEVVGIDLIDSYVERARAKANQAELNLEFSARDAFEFVVTPPCDVAVNWWTSFGYARTDQENIQMCQRAFESLKPGGCFALDFMNVPGVIHDFKPQVVTHGQSEEHGEMTLIRESELDVENGFLLKNWIYFLENGRRVKHRTRVRMYAPVDLNHLFDLAGFRKVNVLGDLDGSSITLHSPRCIIVGFRP